MEIWDLYAKDRKPMGRDHIRGEKIPDGCYHLVVHVWIRNSKGEYLISQRSADRPSFPLMWECVGGSVLKGEDSLTGAVREVKEEIGLSLNPEEGKLVFSQVRDVVDGERFADILDVWLWEYDGDVDLSLADSREVADTAWRSHDEIQELFDAGKLAQTLKYFFTEPLLQNI